MNFHVGRCHRAKPVKFAPIAANVEVKFPRSFHIEAVRDFDKVKNPLVCLRSTAEENPKRPFSYLRRRDIGEVLSLISRRQNGDFQIFATSKFFHLLRSHLRHCHRPTDKDP